MLLAPGRGEEPSVIGYACSGCGRTWPENYCPACHTTIDRNQLPPPLATPTPIIQAAAGVGALPPRELAADWPWPSRTTRATPGSGAGVPFTFTGNASEYFRIWIVNVALTVLTLGVYAAWAKVNKRRYFWGHTQLQGRGFEYTGDPVAILKGNLILGAGAIGYYFASSAQPLLGLAALGAISLVYPWLFCKAMRFNAHHTRHRHIRFGFDGTVGESYAVNLGLLLLVPLTLGAIWPYLQYRRKRYQLEHLRYGTARFRFNGGSGPFYGAFFGAVGIMGIGVALATVAGVALPGAHARWVGLGIGYLVGAVAFVVYAPTRVLNAVLEHTRLEGVASLRGSLRVSELLALELVNLLAIVGTLGLAVPWASVRRAQYRWSRVEATFEGPVERVTAAAAPDPGTFGDVAAEHLEIDIAL